MPFIGRGGSSPPSDTLDQASDLRKRWIGGLFYVYAVWTWCGHGVEMIFGPSHNVTFETVFVQVRALRLQVNVPLGGVSEGGLGPPRL